MIRDENCTEGLQESKIACKIPTDAIADLRILLHFGTAYHEHRAFICSPVVNICLIKQEQRHFHHSFASAVDRKISEPPDRKVVAVAGKLGICLLRLLREYEGLSIQVLNPPVNPFPHLNRKLDLGDLCVKENIEVCQYSMRD